MSIKYAILGLLSWRSLTGYDLKKMFADSVALYWSGNNNQIYRTLVDLHEEGLVTQEIQQQDNYPARKIYSITEKGISRLKKWVLSKPELPDLKNAFLVQLEWADLLDLEELDTLAGEYEDEVLMQFMMLQAKEQPLNAAVARTPREAYLWGMIRESWITFYQNELNWIRKLRKELGEMESNG